MTTTLAQELTKYSYTPGPWRIYAGGMIGSASVRRFPAMTVLEPGNVKGETIGVAMQNAKLIAAAPEMKEALEFIASLGGNLPDDRLTDRTGPNDAAHRGLMYTQARAIARNALAAISGQGVDAPDSE